MTKPIGVHSKARMRLALQHQRHADFERRLGRTLEWAAWSHRDSRNPLHPPPLGHHSPSSAEAKNITYFFSDELAGAVRRRTLRDLLWSG
jgi:hypothetical protein